MKKFSISLLSLFFISSAFSAQGEIPEDASLVATCTESIGQPVEGGPIITGGKIYVFRGILTDGSVYLGAQGELSTPSNTFAIAAGVRTESSGESYAYENAQEIVISEHQGWVPVLSETSSQKTFRFNKGNQTLDLLYKTKDAWVVDPNPFRKPRITASVLMRCIGF
jgi:hypothetical protein